MDEDVSQIATAYGHIGAGFEFVFASTSVEEDVRALLLPLFAYAHRSGDPNLEPLALAILTELKWDWPAFDRSLAEFKAAKRWPYLWQSWELPKTIARGGGLKLRQAKVRLLAHTVSRCA